MIKKNYFVTALCLVFILAIASSASEPNELYNDLERFFQEIKNKQVITVEINEAKFKEANPNKLLDLLKQYDNSENEGVRVQACGFEVKLAKFHTSSVIRQKVLERLVNGLVSKDEIDQHLNRSYSDWIMANFQEKDFTKDANSAIFEALQEKHPRKELIWVTGVAQLKEVLPRLEGFLIDEQQFNAKWRKIGRKWYSTLGWNARLARARMGIEQDINKCIQLADSVEDNFFKVYHLLPDIAYIRRPEAIEYLQQHLNSTIVLKAGNIQEPVASYVLDLLADCLQDFPVEKKLGRGYSQEEIDRARRWMAQQKQWNIIR